MSRDKHHIPSATLRSEVLERDRHRCRKCGYEPEDRKGLELHHVVPVLKDGPTTLDNLHTLCGMCHAEISWIWLDDPPVSYEQWLELTPAVLIMRTLLGLRGDINVLDIPPQVLAKMLGVPCDVAATLLERRRS